MVLPVTISASSYKNPIRVKSGTIRRAFLFSLLFVLMRTVGFAQITVDFIAGSTNVCSGSSVTFTNNSVGALETATYLWDFGAGALPASATGIGPHIVTYTGSGTSTVSLTITDTSAHVLTKTDYISVHAIPAAPFVTVTDNCDTTSTLSTNAAGILLWSTLEMSSAIIVKTPGVYTVTTTVNGCTSTEGSGTANPGLSPAFPLESVDCSRGFNKAVINIISPLGAEYEYRLDGGGYKTSSSFTNVANGSHRISVRNSKGCITVGDYFDISCGCVDPATVTLSSTGGTTCGLTPVTITGNSFGGLADYVTITDNGNGSVSPTMATTSPFSFTYTPRTGDAGKTVVITVTTNNPLGTPCVAAKDTYTLIVDADPSAPKVNRIVGPTCTEPTGSVELTGLPASGTWTLTRSPGGIITTGSGTGITILNLLQGTYTYTVTNDAGCMSESSAAVVIVAQPVTPSPPETGAITNPTCSVSTGSVILSGLPDTGNWTLLRNPGGVATTGSGTSKTVTDLPAGTFTFTVISSAGCTSGPSAAIIIDPQPLNPPVPVIGAITPPTCILATGSAELTGLPVTGTWILTRYPGTIISTGTGPSVTISGLAAGMYNFTVTNSTGCLSAPSANVLIPAQPITPQPPVIGTIILPTCTIATGSVFLSGLPQSGTWTVTRSPGEIITSGSGTSTTISGLPVGKYTFIVTNADGCISGMSSEVSIPLQPGIPSVTITDPPAVCSPGTADLTSVSVTSGSSSGLAYTYWSDAAATIPYLTPASAERGIWYIKGTTLSGCFDIKPVTVTVNTPPLAVGGPDQVLNNIFETSMNADPLSQTETGLWSVISGSAHFADNSLPTTVVNGLSQGTNEFLWRVTSDGCPPVFDTVAIVVNGIKIQSMITPNMDGRNDYFVLQGLNTMGRTELVIFDRRGAKVYQNEDYDNLWNGVDFNDKPLPDDTYFYSIKPENGKPVTGFIVIRR